MSTIFYENVIRPGTLEMDRGKRVERIVDIYENPDSIRVHELIINTENISTERQQPPQHTGSVSVKNRRHRAVPVCLLLLCVLLLTAVIVICVYFTTERNRSLQHNYNLTEEREQLLTKYSEILNQSRILTEEREQLLTKYSEILNLSRILTEERDRFKNKIDELQRGLYEQDRRSDNFKWIYYNFSLYYISSNYKSWSDSREDCKQRGADLVIINSPEEQMFLQKATASNSFWIGLSYTNEQWKWVDGTTLLYSSWMNRHPGAYNHYCARTDTLGLAGDSCDINYKWICEKRILKTPS